MQKPSFTPQQRKVMAVASAAFMTEGIRQVTMDDLAKRLTMSKRTLYELFTDKEALLLACVIDAEVKTKKRHEAFKKTTDNVLEYILLCFDDQLKHLKGQSLAYVDDMRKYTSVVEHVEKHRSSHVDEAVAFLKRGVEQGMFRPEIDYAVFYNLTFRLMAMLSTQPYFRAMSMEDIFMNIAVISLRGCCTEKGNLLIDKFLSTYSTDDAQ